MGRDIAQEIINAVSTHKPDYVVAQLMQEREDKIKKEGLQGKVPTTETILTLAKNTLGNLKLNTMGGVPEPVAVDKGNGTVVLSADPLFDPNEFIQGGNSLYGTGTEFSTKTASSGLNKIFGYIVVGLVGIVILDKLMDGGKK